MSVVDKEKVQAAPIIKIAGGKRQLLPEILPRLPAEIDTYYEPFVGGGAVFFALANEGRFRKAVLGDMNLGLVNLYTMVRDDLSAVAQHLRTHLHKHSEKYYYEQREMQHDRGPAGAARYVYLSKTCFNGLWRVNQSGEMNTPFGDYDNPRILDLDGLRAASLALQGVKIVHADFSKTCAKAGRGDVAYFDSPYLPLTATANFSAYTSDGFGVADHERLAVAFGECVKRGARVLLSNSDTPETRRIFGRPQWKLEKVSARRSISAKGDERDDVFEILVSAPIRR